MAEEFEMRRNYILENISPLIKYCKPAGAFYLLLKIGDMPSGILAQKLLEEEKLATVPGDDFGADGYVRISLPRIWKYKRNDKAVEPVCGRIQK